MCYTTSVNKTPRGTAGFPKQRTHDVVCVGSLVGRVVDLHEYESGLFSYGVRFDGGIKHVSESAITGVVSEFDWNAYWASMAELDAFSWGV